MRKTSARHLAAQQRTSADWCRISASAPMARAQSSRPLPRDKDVYMMFPLELVAPGHLGLS